MLGFFCIAISTYVVTLIRYQNLGVQVAFDFFINWLCILLPEFALSIMSLKPQKTDSAVSASKRHTGKDIALIPGSLAEGIYGVDLQGCCTFVNRAALNMLGFDDESELLGEHIHSLIHHTKRDGSPCLDTDCHVYNSFRQGNVCHVDDEVLWRKDGSSFDVEYHSSPFKSNGEVSGAVVVFSDISERRSIEEVLRQSEERFRSAFENAPHGMALVSTTGQFLRVNRSLCSIVGLGESELLQTDCQSITHADDLKRYFQYAEQLNQGSIDNCQIETRYLHKQGHEVWILLSASTVCSENGTPLYFVMQIQDITQRKDNEGKLLNAREELEQRVIERTRHLRKVNVRLEQEIQQRKQAESILRREHDFKRALLDTLGALVVVLDGEGRIVSFNRACEDVTQFMFEDVKGKFLWDVLLLPQEIDVVRKVFGQLRTGQFPNSYENYWCTKDGGRRLIAWSNTALTDDKGAVEYVIGTGIDVTDERELERREKQRMSDLVHASRLSVMGEMATEIAHELNQPLTSIATYGSACLRMLNADSFNREDGTRALEGIVNQAQRAGEIIRRLRKFVTKGETTRTFYDLNQLVRNVIKLAEMDARAHGVQILNDYSESLALVRVDAILIEQVLLNLLRNAIDAIKGEDASELRIISVRTYQHDVDKIVVSVSDTGPGIDHASKTRIFETFYTTKESGTGVGLAICKSIVEEHGGMLWVEDNIPRGATFFFTLPVDESS